MDVFDLLAKGQLTDLDTALRADPALAASRHPSGASLLAWAFYVGQPDAVALIRPRLSELDPHDAIIVGEIDRVKAALTAGWDANALAADGFTPLGLAAFFQRAEIFDLLLPRSDRIELTEVLAEIEGDTRMPDPRSGGAWRETWSEDHQPDGDRPGFRFVTLERA